jgi:hypothetical protein
MQVRFSNINWDTDGTEVDLPDEVTLDVDDDLDVDEAGADVLSDHYGWCVLNFNWESSTQAPPKKEPS